ncbi:MAG: hypothetical protein H8D67_18770 [Deltaproteobacteria bacterium]|nr:hypothetical protein [Deltaproteobacteria bacterium]
MKKLKAKFQKCFGIPIPKIMLPEENLAALDRKHEDVLLFGSRIAIQKPFLVQGDIGQFIESCPEGYFLIGFWGHGVNSYAFYYSRVDSWSKVFFRLPYGGVYMDNEKMARCIREFLTHYFEFEQEIMEKVRTLLAIESMGVSYYKIVMPGCKTFEFEESLFENPNFREKFGYLFNA